MPDKTGDQHRPVPFTPLSKLERALARGQLGLAEGEMALLHICTDPLEAGLDLLLLAASRLRQEGQPLRLVLHDRRGLIEAVEAGRQAAIHDAGTISHDALTETLRDIIVVPVLSTDPDRRVLLGAVDALICPDRAASDAGIMLEAICVGTPAVWVAGSAQDGVGEDELGWRIPAAPFQGPDPQGLIQALREIAQGLRPEADSFAAARMRALRSCFPGPLPGLPPSPPPPTRLAHPAGRSAAGDPHSQSIVIQGPCNRSGPNPTLDDTLASLRRVFPGAQLIVSTWADSDTDGLDADDIVLSPDPGPLAHPRQAPCNVNRLMLSTANGLAAVTRPLCIKTRSDVTFTASTLTRRALHRADRALSFERRIWTTGLGTWHLPTYLRPFHIADMVHYGTTDDLRRLWTKHQATWDDAFLPDPQALLPRACPEQILLTTYLARIGRPMTLDITIDGRSEVIEASLDLCLGGFDVCDDAASGIRFPTRLDRVRHIVPPETADSFHALRHDLETDRAGTIHRTHAAFHARLHQLLAQPAGANAA